MNEQLEDFLIRLLLGWFLPPVGLLLTLKKQTNPNWRNWWINIVLTILLGIPGSIHAVWFIIATRGSSTQKQSRSNNVSTGSSNTKILHKSQTIVSILASFASIIIGGGGLFIGFKTLENQTGISSGITQKTNYICHFKTGRFSLHYKNAYPFLRITPEIDDNNIITKLKAKDKLISLGLSSDGKWQYVCVDGTVIYGWVSSQYVEQ